MDSKLAEYAFFPLSHIFRENKTIPIRALELALQCLNILISRGWRTTIAPDLAKQLLILLTFLAGGSATEAKSKDVNEELGAIAYTCLTNLFRASDAAGLSVKGSVDSANFPVLGHSVAVLLDGVSNGPSTKVRLAALNALESLISSISDQEALKNFFPGIVSSLTKLLSSSSRSKGPSRILQGSIQMLDKVITKVVSDDNLSCLEANIKTGTDPEGALSVPHDNINKDPWLEATSSQIKLALANIIPLRYHDKDEVRRALFRLCMSIFERCPTSLSHSIPMMIETSTIICAQCSDVDAVELMDNLNAAVAGNTDLLNALKSSLRDWLIALPRIMQSNDDLPKKRSVDQISTALKLIGTQGVILDTLDNVVTKNLQASVASAIKASAAKTIQTVPESNVEVPQVLGPYVASGNTESFPEVMFSQTSQKSTVAGFEELVSQIKSLPLLSTVRRDVVGSLETTSGYDQLANLWIALRLVQDSRSPENEFDRFIAIQPDLQDSHTNLLDDVYDFSLSILSKPTYDTDTDWRLQALSLQAVTLQACHQGSDFRPELVDALYPILERLGSPNSALQHHAITALSLVSNACGYCSPGELIIENVDYLVNAVALKLNTFDISPQAPQVLVMMLRLCGARLIPYLDDLVESIFMILEYYHGYPKLVESMFSVLSTIVEEGNKASATAIMDDPEPIHRIQYCKPISIAELASQLREARMEKLPLDPLPSPSDLETEIEEDPETEPPPPEDKPSDQPPPLSKSLQTITSITTLTQHHLSTSSPSLRLLLLRFLPSAFAPLSRHRDTLLPLVNSLWPVLITRLYDPEPYVCIAACQALISLCRTAGDFMASRFDNEWEKIVTLFRKAEREMLVERKAMGRGGVKQRLWEAVTALVGAVIEWVGLSGEMEDGVWDALGESLARGNGDGLRELRGVLEDLNADALWLIEERARLRAGGEVLERPVFEGVQFPELRV